MKSRDFSCATGILPVLALVAEHGRHVAAARHPRYQGISRRVFIHPTRCLIDISRDQLSVSSTPTPADTGTGRVAAVDYGTVQCAGVALSDSRYARLPSPFEEGYTRRSPQADAESAFVGWRKRNRSRRCSSWGCLFISTGARVRNRAKPAPSAYGLARLTGVRVTYFDERFTTAEAEKYLGAAEFNKKQRKARLDKLAAQILLTAYLESGGASEATSALDA